MDVHSALHNTSQIDARYNDATRSILQLAISHLRCCCTRRKRKEQMPRNDDAWVSSQRAFLSTATTPKTAKAVALPQSGVARRAVRVWTIDRIWTWFALGFLVLLFGLLIG